MLSGRGVSWEWASPDLNREPTDYESGALTDWARGPLGRVTRNTQIKLSLQYFSDFYEEIKIYLAGITMKWMSRLRSSPRPRREFFLSQRPWSSTPNSIPSMWMGASKLRTERDCSESTLPLVLRSRSGSYGELRSTNSVLANRDRTRNWRGLSRCSGLSFTRIYLPHGVRSERKS